MQRDAHDQRLAARLLEHLVEVVDDEVGEGASRHLAVDYRREVVQLLRVRHGPDLPASRVHLVRLVVVSRVEGVRIAGFLEEVRGDEALRDPGAEPALRLLAGLLLDALAAVLEQGLLLHLVHLALALGVGVAMADQLVAALDARLDHLGAIVVKRRVDDGANLQAELAEELETAPDPDAVAVVPPGVAEDVGLAALRAAAGPRARAEGEVLDVETEVRREPAALRPRVVGPPRDRGVR